MTSLTITVHGTPGPQGSKAYKGHRTNKAGKSVPVLAESSKKVKPWREAVEDAARVQLLRIPGWVKLDGPLVAEMHFTLPALKRMPKGRIAHTVYPDLSKLLRSTEDALTTAGVWADDARVVQYCGLSKTYPGLGPYALDQPGAVIRVWQLNAPLIHCSTPTEEKESS